MKIKVIIADDHAVVRKGLKTLLQDETQIEIISEAVDGFDTIDKVLILKPDVLLLDITMPDMSGLEVARILSNKMPTTHVLIFSMHANSEYIIKALENGAKGYLLKDSDKDEIMKAIKAVAKGKKYFPPDISEIIINELLRKTTSKLVEKSNHKTQEAFSSLTQKEIEILKLVVEGKSSREISEMLVLSIRTVDKHRSNIMKKTNAKNTADLVKMAIEN
jgi:DNA-binding NarL/FixJ family response regulator